MLTNIEVKSAKPKDKPYKLADGEGMFLFVLPSGARYWRLKYRFAGKEKLLALGVYPQISLSEARQKKIEAQELLKKGVDPSLSRKIMKGARIDAGANSFEAVAREWYAKYLHTWTKSHSGKTIRRLEADMFPWIGTRPINEITAPELLACLRR